MNKQWTSKRTGGAYGLWFDTIACCYENSIFATVDS